MQEFKRLVKLCWPEQQSYNANPGRAKPEIFVSPIIYPTNGLERVRGGHRIEERGGIGPGEGGRACMWAGGN